MDAREFDQLVSRITGLASRREAMLGMAGGALASVGVAAAADAKQHRGKNRASGKSARGAVGAEGKKGKKRKICLCASYEMLECEDKKVKKNKVRKTLKDNPGSYQGECEPLSKRVPGRDR
ncbi:MAG: hypothetical protein U0075_07600 [Thermomicrobiales bacterium]